MLLPLDSLVIAPVGQFLSAAVVHLVDALDTHRFGGRNCSDLRGSEGLKVENRGRIPIVDAQADGYQTAFAPIRLTKSEQLPGGDLDAVGVVAW